MRVARQERKAAKAARNRYHPGPRAIKPDEEYARAEFKCLLPTVENRRCGFAESEVEPWHLEFMRKLDQRYIIFFRKRGMQPPPVSRDTLYPTTDVLPPEPVLAAGAAKNKYLKGH